MTVDLSTTNLLLGILAAMSVLQGLAFAAAGIFAYRVYRQVMATIAELEARQVAPLTARVNEILADVKSISARINGQVARVDETLSETLERVDETTDRVRTSVREKSRRALAVLRGLRAMVEAALTREPGRHPSPAAGR